MVPWSHRSKSFAFSALTRLGGRKGIRPVKKLERWGAGVVICLERDADLHMVQLMPLPLTVSCFSKIQTGFTFLVPAYPGSPGKRAVKRVCVCWSHRSKSTPNWDVDQFIRFCMVRARDQHRDRPRILFYVFRCGPMVLVPRWDSYKRVVESSHHRWRRQDLARGGAQNDIEITKSHAYNNTK